MATAVSGVLKLFVPTSISTPEFVAPAHTPEWFLHAIALPRTAHTAVTADGIHINYVCWNEHERHKPALLFVHGYRAHSHVWDFIAPYFTQNFRVVALDLSGMGDSDRRPDYDDYGVFHADIHTVIDAAGLSPVTLVAHSFGGSRSTQFVADQPECVQRLVIVDAMISFREIDEVRELPKLGRAHPYPDYGTIIARYRLLPEQPAPDWSVAYMAHHSVCAVENGWMWKFDINLPAGRIEFTTQEALKKLTVPTDYICGEHSAVLTGERARLITDAIGQGREAIVIPEAHHHIMLDQPLAFISALRALLADKPKPK